MRNYVWKLRKFSVEGSITDIGSGPGTLLAITAKEQPTAKLIGVDISKEMIVGAKANFDSLGLGKRAEFKEGPADHLPFEDRT